MLRGIDALVFDIQDVGARFYTYETTMAYALEAAAKAGIPYYVLDRPNPITARTWKAHCWTPPTSRSSAITPASRCATA